MKETAYGPMFEVGDKVRLRSAPSLPHGEVIHITTHGDSPQEFCQVEWNSAPGHPYYYYPHYELMPYDPGVQYADPLFIRSLEWQIEREEQEKALYD